MIGRSPHATKRTVWTALLTAGVLLTPGLASACSVCMSGRDDENKLAFILTTAFLTVLPLGLIGGVIFYIRGLFREADRKETARREAAPVHARTDWRASATQRL